MDVSATSVALNLLGLIGAAAYVLTQAFAKDASPVDRRLAALFGILTTLVGVRAARWWFSIESLRRFEEALAASLPLVALILAEGLLRRHAPARLKVVIAVGSLIFVIAAVARPVSAAGGFAYALGGYVLMALSSVGLMLALRDRKSLSRAENSAISALFTGLLFALPLSATDFLAAAGVSPIRGGGLGLLFFVMAVARATTVGGGGIGVLIEALWACAAAGLGFAVFAFVFPWPGLIGALNVGALILALVLTLRTIFYLREQGAARSRSSLWRAFAEAPTETLDAFLDRMLAAPELSRARLLDAAALGGYDTPGLVRAFDASTVIDMNAARPHEQLSMLFDETEATHAILISRSPIRLLFVSLPRVGAGGDVDVQLRLLAKLAARAAHA